MRRDINNFVQYCEAERGFSKTTITNYKANLKRFFEYIKDIPLEKITPHVIREFLKQFDGIYRRISLVSTLKCFGKMLKAEGKHNPFGHLGYIKVPRKIPLILSETETTKLFDSLETPEEKIVFETLYSTGMRMGEYLRLDIKDIDFKNGAVRINKAKMGSVGIIPIGSRALKLIKKYGLPKLTKPDIYAMFQKYSVILGKRIWPHMLRHCCATHMLNRGADIRFVQEQLRHSNINSTVRYTQVCPKTLIKTRNLLDKKDFPGGYLPSFPTEKPKVKTPKEIEEEKKFVESYKDVMKREEVNPLLNAKEASKILGMYKQSVVGYARTGELRGEYMKGCGWFFRKKYIDFVNKIEPDWLVAHRKLKKRDIKEMIKKTIEVLRKTGKKLAPDDNRTIRIHANKAMYMSSKELAEHLGVGPQYISKTLIPALHKYVKMQAWAKQKLMEAYQKEMGEELKQLEIHREEISEGLRQIEEKDVIDVLV